MQSLNNNFLTYHNFQITKVYNKNTKNSEIQTVCHEYSMNNTDFELLKAKKSLWFFNHQLTRMTVNYINSMENIDLKTMHEIALKKYQQSPKYETCLTSWPTLQTLENLPKTPFEGLKEMNVNTIKHYLHGFNMCEEDETEWNDLLNKCTALEKKCCPECMNIRSQIGNAMTEAKHTHGSDSVGKLKDKYKKMLQTHLRNVDYHMNVDDNNNSNNSKHLFKILRNIKRGIQAKMQLTKTSANYDDSHISQHLFVNYDSKYQQSRELENIENEILKRCNMWSSGMAKMIEALEMETEFESHTTHHINNDFRLAANCVKTDFIETRIKTTQDNKLKNVCISLNSDELNEIMSLDNYFDFQSLSNINVSEPHCILILKNNLNYDDIFKHCWMLFYCVDTWTDSNKTIYMGSFLNNINQYSLCDLWSFPEIDLQDNHLMKSMHETVMSKFRQNCKIQGRHNQKKTVFVNECMTTLNEWDNHNDGEFILFHRPLVHQQDFTLNYQCKRHVISFKQHVVGELEFNMFEQCKRMFMEDLEIITNNSDNIEKLKHNCKLIVKNLFTKSIPNVLPITNPLNC